MKCKEIGILLSVTGFASFSCMDALSKFFSNTGYSPFQISCLSAFFALTCLFVFSKPMGGVRNTFKTKNIRMHILRGLLCAPIGAINYYGFSVLPLANAYPLIFLGPIFTVLIAAIFLKEKTCKLNWSLIAISFVGVVLAMRPDVYGFTVASFLLVLTAFLGSLVNIIARMFPKDETLFSYAFFPLVAIFISMLFPTILYWKIPSTLDTLLFMIGGVALAVGTLFTSLSFRYASAAIVAPFNYTQLIWAAVFGSLFFEGFPDAWTLAGCALISIAGIGLIRLKKA